MGTPRKDMEPGRQGKAQRECQGEVRQEGLQKECGNSVRE